MLLFDLRKFEVKMGFGLGNLSLTIVYRCSNCGINTRCIQCTWLVAFCKIRDDYIDDLVPIPYKKPYIEMFEDIRDGILSGDFSVEQITIFFEETSGELYRDCKDCENGKVIQPVAFAIREGSSKKYFN